MTAARPLVSVVVPVRNRASLIEETLVSIWQQTHRPIELIVVDDGSDDGTRPSAENWLHGHRDDQFQTTYVLQDRQSASAARNRGAVLASGELLQFFDSDDIMLPEKLARQVSELLKADLDFVACDYALFREKPSNRTMTVRLSRRGHGPAQHVLRCALNTHAPLFKKEALERVGEWNEELSRWDDLEFTFRVLARGLKGLWLNEVHYLVRDHGNGLTCDDDGYLDDSCVKSCLAMERIAEECGLDDAAFRNAIGRRMVNLSYMLSERGRTNKADEVFREAQKRLSPAFRIAHILLRAVRRTGK